MKNLSLTTFVLILIFISSVLSISTSNLNSNFITNSNEKANIKSFFKDKTNSLTKQNHELENMQKKHQDKLKKKNSKSKKEKRTNKATSTNEISKLKDDTPIIQKPYDINQILNTNETLQVSLKNWMKISSPQFSDLTVYPDIVMPDYKKKALPFGVSNFRINKYYTKKTYDDKYPPSRYHFWFRYSDKNLYYTNHPDSLHVLGSMNIRSLTKVTLSTQSDFSGCLTLTNSNGDEWDICPDTSQIKMKWFCKINEDLGMDVNDCKTLVMESIEPTIIEQKITQPIVLIPLPSRECNDGYDYKKNGSDWECDCKDGKEQSPIDIPSIDSGKSFKSPVKPVFSYVDAPALQTDDSFDGLLTKNDYVKIFFNKGLLKIKHPNFGKVVTLDGVVYQAQEIRIHTPSEHKIDGQSFDLEVEVIHFGQTPGDIGKQLILNVLFTKTPGVYNKFIDDIDVFNLPNPVLKHRQIKNDLNICKLFFNDEEDGFNYMKDFDFYTYQGSMTAPPCTERTIHLVTANPIALSTTALTLLKEAIKTPDTIDASGNVILNTSKTDNNRATQPLNGRKVYYYQSPPKEEVPKVVKPTPTSTGHYEKVKKTMVSYFHVSTDTPSGLPGAFLVSENVAKGTA